MSFSTSIRGKIILFFLTMFFIFLSSVHGFLFYRLEKIVIGAIDEHLHSEVQLIATLLELEGEEFEVELTEANVGEFSVPLSGHYFQIYTKKRGVVARSLSLALPDIYLPRSENPTGFSLKTVVGPSGKRLRMINEEVETDTEAGLITIQASEPLRETERLLGSYKKTMLTIIPLVFLFSIPCIWFITTSSLRKLKTLSHQMEKITEFNINQQVDIHPLDTELRPLGLAFNDLLVRLEGAFEQQRRFLSNASHDLRTPLSVMKTMCQVTLSKERTPDEYREALKDINTSAEGMASIVDKVLAMSRLEASAFSLDCHSIDTYETLKSITAFLSPQANQRNITLELEGESVFLSCDESQIKELFLNIIENAIKYSEVEGRVSINLSKNSGEALITVADEGIGVDPKDQDRIFERFYRVDRSGNMKKGCGLGLSIASGIATKHGGKITVKGAHQRGSVFTIHLPLSQSAPSLGIRNI